MGAITRSEGSPLAAPRFRVNMSVKAGSLGRGRGDPGDPGEFPGFFPGNSRKSMGKSWEIRQGTWNSWDVYMDLYEKYGINMVICDGL